MSIFSRTSEAKNPHHAGYRADIDGLRALAIVPVILFHAFPEILPGGFVGVDIFFVISGFLISTIIVRELRKGNFSFHGFYARRIRRLFPALALVLVSVIIFGWLALDADEYKMLGKHVAAGAGFVQNFVLWGEVGYFDTSGSLKPLLHLWSLAIEEQFYLLFPLVVWLAWRIRLNLLTLVAAIAVCSLIANLYWIGLDRSGAFYFPHTRIWELMAGAILAITYEQSSAPLAGGSGGRSIDPIQGAEPDRKDNRFLRSILSWLGLGLIIVATLAFDKDHNFPGWRAIIPVLGAVLIIHAGQSSWLNQYLFSNRLLVVIGLISYPLYLWHWPLLSFARIIESGPLTFSLKLALIAISVLLATLTYVLVEKPIRSGRFQSIWTVILVTMMLGIGILGYMIYERELTSKLGVRVEAVKEWERRHASFEKNCAEYFPEWNKRRDSFKCAFLEKGKPEITVIGDSHARRIFMGVSHFLLDDHNTGFFANACSMPFYDISADIHPVFRTPDYQYPRTKQINQALDFSINDPSVKLVIMTTSACWRHIVDINNPNYRNQGRTVESKMRLTFDRLRKSGKQVIYVLDNPLLNFDPKSCVSRPFRNNSEVSSCKMTRETFDNQRVEYFKIAKNVLSDYPEIKVFDVASQLCDDEHCYAVIDDELLYQDQSHLSFDGSIYVGQFLLPMIKDVLNIEK